MGVVVVRDDGVAVALTEPYADYQQLTPDR